MTKFQVPIEARGRVSRKAMIQLGQKDASARRPRGHHALYYVRKSAFRLFIALNFLLSVLDVHAMDLNNLIPCTERPRCRRVC